MGSLLLQVVEVVVVVVVVGVLVLGYKVVLGPC